MGKLSQSYLKELAEKKKYKSGGFSTEGYKRNSPDVNNPYNVIPSNQITMEGVDFPVMGIDDIGNQQMMYPGNNYTFPGNYVTEFPVKNMGNKRFGQVGFQNRGEISTEKSPIEMPYVEIRAKRNPLARVKPYKWDPNTRSPLAKNTQVQDQVRTQYYKKPEEQMAGISETKKEDLRRKISGVLRETTQADKDWAAEQASRKALTFSGATDGSVLGGMLDLVNPFSYYYAGKDAVRGAGETAQAIYEGNPDAVAAGLFKTGLNAAAFLPATQVGKFANAIGTEARLINRLKPLSVQRNLGDISKEAYKSLGRKAYQEAARNPFNVSEYLATQTPSLKTLVASRQLNNAKINQELAKKYYANKILQEKLIGPNIEFKGYTSEFPSGEIFDYRGAPYIKIKDRVYYPNTVFKGTGLPEESSTSIRLLDETEKFIANKYDSKYRKQLQKKLGISKEPKSTSLDDAEFEVNQTIQPYNDWIIHNDFGRISGNETWWNRGTPYQAMTPWSTFDTPPSGRYLFAPQKSLESYTGKPLQHHRALFGDPQGPKVPRKGITVTSTTEADLPSIKGLESYNYNPLIGTYEKGIFQQPKGTYQMGGTMSIPGVNGQVVSSGPQPLTSVKKTRGPITKTKAGVKTMSNKQVKKILKNIK